MLKYIFSRQATFVIVSCLLASLLHAEKPSSSVLPIQSQHKKVEQKHVCPPCDEPVQGTALWHYMKGVEEIMGMNSNAYLANEHFKRAADMDYAPAIKALADSYYSGDGIDKDTNQALALYIRAADLGDGSAQFNAGIILLRGYAAEANYELAFYYLCLATMNEGLDEMAQDAAVYRDEAGNLLTSEQAQTVYRRLVNNPATKPHKQSCKNS